MSRQIPLRLATLSAVALGLAGLAVAEEPTNEATRAAALSVIAKIEAQAYEFRPERDGESFVLHPEPVLKWSNPVVGALYGNVYLWTSKGRPEVAVSINRLFSPPPPRRNNEFHSLSLEKFVASREGQNVWRPNRPGVELKDIPGAPAPAETPARRLRQMRDLASQFVVRLTSRQNVTSDLRLLTQPVYRYEKTEGDLIDGSLFIFVQGTDPQAMLMIEDRNVEGTPRWQFAMARMIGVKLNATVRGREVWSVPTISWAQIYDYNEPYANFSMPVVLSPPAQNSSQKSPAP